MRGIFVSWEREVTREADKGGWQLLGNQVPEEAEELRRGGLDHTGRGNSNWEWNTS